LADKNPVIAGLTEDPSAIILAGVRVCYNKGWGRFFDALACKATLAMGIPWDRAERGIWAQADPLVTGRTENAVRVKLSYVRVGTKVLNTLLLGTFSPSTLGRWPGDVGVGVGVSLEFRRGTGGPRL